MIFLSHSPCYQQNQWEINSLAPGRCDNDFKSIIFKLIVQNKSLDTHCEIALRWMAQNLYNEKSASFKYWLGCHQALAFYPMPVHLSQIGNFICRVCTRHLWCPIPIWHTGNMIVKDIMKQICVPLENSAYFGDGSIHLGTIETETILVGSSDFIAMIKTS